MTMLIFLGYVLIGLIMTIGFTIYWYQREYLLGPLIACWIVVGSLAWPLVLMDMGSWVDYGTYSNYNPMGKERVWNRKRYR